MRKQWNRIRILLAILMLFAWGIIVYLLVNGNIPVRMDEANGSHFYWSLIILFVLVILVLIHICFQWIGRHLEYVSFLFNIVLFVSSVTLLTSLGIAYTTEEPIEKWVIPFTVLGVFAMLVCVLAQAIALRIARDKFRSKLEEVIWDIVTPDITTGQKRALIEACKRMMPIDFYPNGVASRLSDCPQTWNDIINLLTQHGVEWKDEYFSVVRGVEIPMVRWAEQAYFYFGLAGWWIGSIVMILGTVALNSKSI